MENDRHYAIRGGETSVPLLCAGVGSCGNQSALSRRRAASVEPRSATDGLQGLCHEPSLTAMKTFPGGGGRIHSFHFIPKRDSHPNNIKNQYASRSKKKETMEKVSYVLACTCVCTCVHYVHFSLSCLCLGSLTWVQSPKLCLF